jgi:hypothetical protein
MNRFNLGRVLPAGRKNEVKEVIANDGELS